MHEYHRLKSVPLKSELIPIPHGHSASAAVDSPTDAAISPVKDILEINEDSLSGRRSDTLLAGQTAHKT